MEQLVASLVGNVRRESVDGRAYLVAPVSMIVPGVLNGSNKRMPRLGTGVYLIYNTMTDKSYVGSSSRSIAKRISHHIRSLTRGTHPNQYLQRAWDVYGKDAFEFYVLEKCESIKCTGVEQAWIDKMSSSVRDKGYNISPTAESCFGVVRSEEVKRRMSAGAKRRWQSNPLNQESRDKIALALTGRKLSAEHVAKTAAGNRGQKRSLEAIEKTAAKHRGMKRSPETCLRISFSKRRCSV